ncbi:MAG: hypothetical protein DRJ45_05230 [Thermoprotei archaeon]|nr:MAG: hypothetical protein DRJ45_05230 [Thermoprotei archaeon]
MSEFKLLADENIEKGLVMELKERGFDIRYCDKGLKNSELIKISAEEKRALLTHDKDSLQEYLYKFAKGIIVIPVLPIEEMVEILLRFFSRFKGELKGRAFLLSKEGVIVFESRE